ncbi:MAG TPA: hypothetical protein VGN12_12160 [Pirellulales bacterium]|jgi:hypothetical protein
MVSELGIARNANERASMRQTFWRRRAIVALCVLAAVIASVAALTRYFRQGNWEFVQLATNIHVPCAVSELQIIEDPSFIHPAWIFVRCHVPSDRVKEIATLNDLEATDRTELRRKRDAIPKELLVVSGNTDRFYKSGKTKHGLPFEVLLDGNGELAIFVATPD